MSRKIAAYAIVGVMFGVGGARAQDLRDASGAECPAIDFLCDGVFAMSGVGNGAVRCALTNGLAPRGDCGFAPTWANEHIGPARRYADRVCEAVVTGPTSTDSLETASDKAKGQTPDSPQTATKNRRRPVTSGLTWLAGFFAKAVVEGNQ
jgi:hypothetical protein